ncbi:MAG: nucleoside triphosphate pyrophosphohydrolase [Coriobacteriia bacterium]|nr:nucleoside triphosphate pyrophosphohydrolase [Coriobacteriia bacterium]
MKQVPRPEESPKHPNFDVFVEVIRILRSPGGCPWDIKQTHASIAKNMIEEAYEAVDTIEQNDIEHLKEELGDVLEQVVLQSQIAADAHEFTIDDVIEGVTNKMVRRHPHVFGDMSEVPDDPDEVLALWDQVKLEEQKAKNKGEAVKESLLASVPQSLPALMQAQKISRKLVSAGFEWDSVDDVWKKFQEEVEEFKDAQAQKDAELEFGDMLFTLVNIGRKLGIDAEVALKKTNAKVKKRWEFMEREAWDNNQEIQDLSLEEQEALWQQAKTKE